MNALAAFPALVRGLSNPMRHRQYRSFLKTVKPFGLGDVRLDRDLTKEPAYAEYRELLSQHPRMQGRRKSVFNGALRFMLKYDKFMRTPNVYTMCGIVQMWSLVACAEHVLQRNVPGDFFEAGSWRGGMGIVMKEVLRRHGDEQRAVWLADAWSGRFPESPDSEQDSSLEDLLNRLFDTSPDAEEVAENFRAVGLMDDRVRLVPGYFCDTLPGLDVGPLAILRLDADLYNSTTDALTHLYPKLSPGGIAIIDDYGIKLCDCRKAVDEYRAENGITDPIQVVDGQCVFWKKSGGGSV